MGIRIQIIPDIKKSSQNFNIFIKQHQRLIKHFCLWHGIFLIPDSSPILMFLNFQIRCYFTKTCIILSTLLSVLAELLTSQLGNFSIVIICFHVLPHLQNNVLHGEENKKSFPIGLYFQLSSIIFCNSGGQKSIYFIDKNQ